MNILHKYAHLLVDYCLELKEGDKLYISTTTEAIPLVREVYRAALKMGCIVEYDLGIMGHNRIFYNEAHTEEQLSHLPTLKSRAMKEYDAYLAIRAPYNLMEDQGLDAAKQKKRKLYTKPLNEYYFKRTATRELKRNLCQYPTLASAQAAKMSLEEYSKFVYSACRLYDEDPKASWLGVRAEQQKIVDLLNTKSEIRYKGKKTDIKFSIKDRTWINSDGQTNMPSGEVFSGPVEDSVNGVVHFDYPAIFMGEDVEGITLWVEDGQVMKWEAEKGKHILDKVFAIDGARYFGEVAIGTNYRITRATRNILFDEKIGGSIHMAVGQSYAQTGGKNESSIHWDMISDMKEGGEIYADDEKIYENGQFIVF